MLKDHLIKNKRKASCVLHLGNHNVGNDGVYDLAFSLHLNTTLKTLDLSRNNITKEGFTNLSRALKANTGLTSLALKRSYLDADIRAIFEQIRQDKSSLSIDF